MHLLSAAILTSVADDCKRHEDAGRFGRAPNRHLIPARRLDRQKAASNSNRRTRVQFAQ
jgi:hypothetical protein